MKSFQCTSRTHDKGSTIEKGFSKTEEHFGSLLDDQYRSKFAVWMENNKFQLEVEDIGIPDCCAISNFVWNPISLTWEPNIYI
ncbi:hypothetical protein Bca101_056436 [Brassica carinata]